MLVDVKAFEGRLSTLDSLNLIRKEFVKIRWKGIEKAAIVDLATGKGRFLETAAQNRGFNLRIYAEENKARAWLLGD